MRGRAVSHAWSPGMVIGALLLVAVSIVAGWSALSSAAARPGAHSLRVGGATYTVTHVEQVAGLSEADLAGMSHGIQGLVGVDQTLIRVSVTVSTGGSAATYDPRTLEVFSLPSDAALAPLGGSLSGGRLRAHSRIDGSLSYVVPRNGARLVLRVVGGAGQVPLLKADHFTTGGSSPPAAN
jgi:hypothetical protein